jgi:hypothetical protein
MMVAHHPPFTNSNSSQILKATHEPALINPFW